MSIPNYDTPVVNGWTPMGPGGGGTVFAPVISPHDPGIMSVISDMAGTFLSKDGGLTWAYLFFEGVTDVLCFDPLDSNTIYVGARSSGLHKSTDGGKSWVNLRRSFSCATEVNRIAIDPADNNIVYVCAGPSGFHVSYDGGLTWQIDALSNLPTGEYHGRRYSNSGAGAGWMKDMTTMLYVDPDSPLDSRVLYTFNRSTKDGVISKINKITRTGTTLENYKYALSFIDPPAPTNILSIDWVYDKDGKAGEKTTYYLTMSWSGPMTEVSYDPKSDMYDGSVWKSANLNEPGSYTLIADNNTQALREIFNEHNQHPKDHLILCRMKAASNRVYYLQTTNQGQGGKRLQYGYLLSADAGATWKWLVFKEENALIYPSVDRCPPSWLDSHFGYEYPGAAWGMEVSKTGPASNDPVDITIISVDQGQIHISSDGGHKWRHGHCETKTGNDGIVYGKTNGIQMTSTYDISFDPFDCKHIIISKTDVGMLVSYDGGEYFKPSEKGLMPDFGWAKYDFRVHAKDYFRYWTNTCYRTVFDPDIKGKLWSVWSGAHDIPGRPINQRFPGCVAVSVDGGETWKVQGGYPGYTIDGDYTNGIGGIPGNALLTDLMIDAKSPAESRTLYVAAMNKGIFKSIDGGCNWEAKLNGINPVGGYDEGLQYPASRLMMTPDGTLYASIYNNGSITGQMYISYDDANSWQKLTMPGGSLFVYNMDYDWSDASYKTLYAAADDSIIKGEHTGGIYKSVDGGKSWVRLLGPIMDANHNTCPARGILVDCRNPETVYASTGNGFLLKSTNAGESWERMGFNHSWHECLRQNPHEEDMLYVVTHGCGVWYGVKGTVY